MDENVQVQDKTVMVQILVLQSANQICSHSSKQETSTLDSLGFHLEMTRNHVIGNLHSDFGFSLECWA